MKFLADHDVYVAAIRFLSGLGHDVVPVAQLGLAQADDDHLLHVAAEDQRILITRDRDYGGLVFVSHSGAGVFYLRILPSTQASVHAELERVVSTHSEQELLDSFVVVEPGRHRIRRVRPDQGKNHV